MKDKNPLENFSKEAPEVATAFDNLIKALINTKWLDAKTKQLIYIGIKVSQWDEKAVYFHVPMAKKLGATREEIKDTVLLTLTVVGIKWVASCLDLALDVYDNS